MFDLGMIGTGLAGLLGYNGLPTPKFFNPRHDQKGSCCAGALLLCVVADLPQPFESPVLV